MRFFKSFTLLHRRSKSDGAVDKSIPKENTKRRTHSLPVDVDVFDTAVPHANPASTPVPMSSSFYVDQIKSLEQDKSQLNATIQVLVAQIAQLKGELVVVRDDQHAYIARETYLTRQAKEDEEEIIRLEEKVARYVKFIDLMVDIGLHENVFADACGALRAGQDPEEALIDSIKEAAVRKDSPWSKIIPAITGPRTPEEYVSAIQTILKTRKELRNCRKISEFWKRAAKENTDVHANTLTPSASAISSIHELLSEDRQAAVAALIAKRKAGCNSARNSLLQGLDPDLDDDSDRSPVVSDTCAFSPIHDENGGFTFSNTQISLISQKVDTNENSDLDLEYTSEANVLLTIKPYVANLPPLASESFRDELVASVSYRSTAKHITNSTSKQAVRNPLAPIDMNGPHSSQPIIPRDHPTTTKTSGKMVVESTENTDIVNAADHSSSIPPAADPFIEALSASLLLVPEERQPKSDPYRSSIGPVSFENSAFAPLITSSETCDSDTSTVKPIRLPNTSPDRKPDPSIDVLSGTAGKVSEERDQCQDLPRDIHSNLHDDTADKIQETIILSPAKIVDSIAPSTSHSSLSPTRTAVASSTEGTPVKKSLLPTLKRKTLFSPSSSPVKTQRSDSPAAPSGTKMTKAKSNIGGRFKIPKTGIKVVGSVIPAAATAAASSQKTPVVSPSKQKPDTKRSPSRLPTFSRLLPSTSLRNQTKWLFDN